MDSKFVHFLKTICLPAKIYLALILLNFLSLFLIKKEKDDIVIIIASLIVVLLIGLAVTWFGNYLCSQGLEFITWLIVLIPLINLYRNLRKL